MGYMDMRRCEVYMVFKQFTLGQLGYINQRVWIYSQEN